MVTWLSRGGVTSHVTNMFTFQEQQQRASRVCALARGHLPTGESPRRAVYSRCWEAARAACTGAKTGSQLTGSLRGPDLYTTLYTALRYYTASSGKVA